MGSVDDESSAFKLIKVPTRGLKFSTPVSSACSAL
jgi:hypothetical protein